MLDFDFISEVEKELEEGAVKETLNIILNAVEPRKQSKFSQSTDIEDRIRTKGENTLTIGFTGEELLTLGAALQHYGRDLVEELEKDLDDKKDTPGIEEEVEQANERLHLLHTTLDKIDEAVADGKKPLFTEEEIAHLNKRIEEREEE